RHDEPPWFAILNLTRPHQGIAQESRFQGLGISGLKPEDYREHDDWFDLMKDCKAADVDREEFIEWSTSDPLYADHAERIGRRWDSLGITGWSLRVEDRLAELNKGRCPKRRFKLPIHHSEPCQLPLSARAQQTINLQRRTSSILNQVRKGQEPL